MKINIYITVCVQICHAAIVLILQALLPY